MTALPTSAAASCLVRWLAALAAALLALAQPVHAQTDHQPPRFCHAVPAQGETATDLIVRADGWSCTNRGWSLRDDRALLRFDRLPDGRVPARLVMRIADFDEVRVGIAGTDGAVTWHTLDDSAFGPVGKMQMATPLPSSGQPARAVFVAVSGITSSPSLSLTQLEPLAEGGYGGAELFVAMLWGLMIAPLLFNIAFYRVLREQFLIWHALTVACLLTQVTLTSGLAHLVPGLGIGAIVNAIPLSFGASAAAAMLLCLHFVEPHAFDAVHRRALLINAWTIAILSIGFAALAQTYRETALKIYFAGWIPVALSVFWLLWVAARRGSRAIRYQIAAWVPLLLVGLSRIVFNVADWNEPMVLFHLQDAAIGLEVLIISLGVADRLVAMRRDLDRHRHQATRLEHLAERDPLTGLRNRRALEPRFAELRGKGFTTFALIDLDRFKSVNDVHGHAVGDHVLCAVARALDIDPDAIAMRLGGEEFVLMLRGADCLRRAESLRQAIPARVARDVDGLDRLVTASMGVLEIPVEVMPDAGFATIYARADDLLYQAKRGGRNRTVSEKLTSFARGPRRRGQAAA